MLKSILQEVSKCVLCESQLTHGVRPVLSLSEKSKILIIGQAPGSKVHQSGVPWDDPSGDQLRKWLDVSKEEFYNPDYFGIMPMGFCYPGKGKSGDLPPRPECEPTWHKRLLNEMTDVKLTLLIGQYAQKAYLKENNKRNLTETVKAYHEFLPNYLPLPHPSPRNRFWMAKNEWFKSDVLPYLKQVVKESIDR